jgi:large repetitive protein
MLRSLVALAVCLSSGALADGFGRGDGHWGPLVVSAGSTVLNSYQPLLAEAAPGADVLAVQTGTGLRAGDLILLLQVRSVSPANVGDQTPVDVEREAAGSWHWARVTAALSNSVRINPPVSSRFVAAATQMIVVPEYTTVNIESGAVVTAPAWNGLSGGAVIFLATGAVQVDGVVDVTGLGLRGGTASRQNDQTDCVGLTESESLGGLRGEGLGPSTDGSDAGRGNVSVGGGGGICDSSGGGGGGHQSEGGQGGVSYDGERAIGGLGGARVGISPVRLLFGGGGGAGSNEFGPFSGGGSGGGLVWIRAATIGGSGRWLAKGAAGSSTTTGSGGGGAGGTLFLEAPSIDCIEADVSGGAGGSMTSNSIPHGTGGGGGGGLVRLSVGQLSARCALRTASGLAGVATLTPVSAGDARFAGATPRSSTVANGGRVSVEPFDAGTSDAGVSDAGVADAGGGDGGSPLDGGALDLAVVRIGCGCGTDSSAIVLVLALGAVLARRSRLRGLKRR